MCAEKMQTQFFDAHISSEFFLQAATLNVADALGAERATFAVLNLKRSGQLFNNAFLLRLLYKS